MKVAAIVFGLLIVVFPVSAQSSPSACALPETLRNAIATKYPGAKVVTGSDLTEDNRQFFETDHHAACPGLVTVDFYGDRKPTFALELITRSQSGRKTKVVVARQMGGHWNFALVDELSGEASPVIWSDKPGDYEGVWGDKLHAAHSVIVWQGYESWAVLYAWNGRKVEHIQLVD